MTIKFNYLQEYSVDSRCISNFSIWVRIGFRQSHFYFMNFFGPHFGHEFLPFFSVKISVGLPTNPDAESRKFNTLLYLNYCVAKIEIQNLTNYKPIKWSVVLADNTLILGRMEEQCGHGCILHGVMGKLKWHLCAQVLLIFNSRLILDFFLFLNWAFLDWNPKNL